MFKRMMAGLGAGGAEVDCVLTNPNVYPGGVLEGSINITGGEVDQTIKYVAVSLRAEVEVESDDYEYDDHVEFGHERLTDRFTVDAHEEISFPFSIQIPWETPINVVAGQPIPGIEIGLKTELEVRGVDASDLDDVRIHPLPAQVRILEAIERLGWRFKGADLEQGTLDDSELPIYQEIEFAPPAHLAGQINELELTFQATEESLWVYLEVDRQGGWFDDGGDEVTTFEVGYHELGHDWESEIDAHIQEIGRRRGLFG